MTPHRVSCRVGRRGSFARAPEDGKIREEWPSESDQYAVDEMLA